MANFVQKIKIVRSSWNSVQTLIRISIDFDGDFYLFVSFFVLCFNLRLEKLFLSKFRPKIQNCLFKVKSDTNTNWNMQNSMLLFIYLLDWKYPFWANLAHQIKYVSLSWNLVIILIRIWIILWWCSFFLFSTGIIIFSEICAKKLILLFKLKFRTRLIWICQCCWWFSFFSFLDWKCHFCVNLVQKCKIISLSWNLLPRLFQICKSRLWSSLFLFYKFFANLSKNSWLICQQFTRRDLKPVAFLLIYNFKSENVLKII